MAARKKQAQDLDAYSPLEAYCIGLHEYYKGLRKAGFSIEICMALLMDKGSYPDWLLPKPVTFNPNNPDHTPYEDDED